MKELLCTSIFRDKSDNITGYRLVDRKGQAKEIKKDALKEMIRSKKVSVINLTLTSNNRLITKGFEMSKKDFERMTKRNIKDTAEEITVKLSFSADIEAGTYTELERSLCNHIDGLIDFDGCPEIKYASDVKVKALNGNAEELISKIYVSMCLRIEKSFLSTLKGYVGHHIDYIMNLDDYYEIKRIYGCKILGWKK